MPLSRRQLVTHAGLLVAGVSGLWTLWLIFVGGVDATLLGMRITSNDPVRPIVLLVLGLGMSAAAAGLHASAQAILRMPTLPCALLIAAAVLVGGLRWGTAVVGGADSYGYVSQADLWLGGQLTIEQPWAAPVPWPNAAWTFSPLGYRPKGVREGGEIVEQRTAIVPLYSPGLPLLMAGAKRLAGQPGVFAVVPIFGALLVLATYALGRRLGSPHAGLLAAWFVATSPVMLYMLVQPMSDVPTAAIWALALWCLLGRSTGSVAAAGALSGLAVLIRPNLVPIAGVLVVWLAARAWRTRSAERGPLIRRALAFSASALPGILLVAVLNWTWHGSPLRSGYPPLRDMFDWANIAINLPYYTRLFVDTQTPFALIGGLALLIPRAWTLPRLDRGWILALLGAVTAIVVAQYLAYAHFDDWSSLRFLLPVWPIVMLAFATMLVQVLRLGRPIAALAATGLAMAIGVHTVQGAAERNAFSLWRGEAAYAAIAQLVRERTEPNAVLFSMQHSGSLRYYSGRTTIQFGHMDPDWLDAAAAWLDGHGAHPYAVLADWEVAAFRKMFGFTNVLGRLEMAPLLEYHNYGPTILVFDLRAGARHPTERVVVPPPVPSWPGPEPRPSLVLR
jgi:hypothetical protein